MVAGEVRRGFFQEVVLHLQFPVFPFDLTQTRAVGHGKRRLLAGMLTTVNGDPIPESTLVDTELFRHPGNRTRRLDHHLHGFFPEFRREDFLRSRQVFNLSRYSILMDGLSGNLGAPHGRRWGYTS